MTVSARSTPRSEIYAALDAQAFQRCFVNWVAGLTRTPVEVIAIDGKTSRGSLSTHETVDAEHGRVEAPRDTVFHDLGWLQVRHDWPGLNGIVMVESERRTAAKTERETRFYLTSLTARAEPCGPMIRDHRAIENALHWVMDMTFRDDECRVRTDHAPASFATLRHIAHNLVRRAPGKHPLRLRRKTAAWDDTYLVSLIAA